MSDENETDQDQELTDLEKKEAQELGFVAAAANSIMRENNLEPNFDPIKNSPLWEADPESIDELFTRIDKKLIAGLPREITDSDIDRVVAYYREQRIRFVQDQANMVKPGKRGESKSTNAIIERLKANPLSF